MLSAGQIFDGYNLIRLIGKGGFGEVWLCRQDAMNDFRALKFISSKNVDLLERELVSLQNYRGASAKIRSPHLMLIEHANRVEDGLYYIMPLADGMDENISPEDPAWHPRTLAGIVSARRTARTWFSCAEIIGLLSPVLRALQLLADNGLVHRDVKPDNILLFAGCPCLGDIGLLGEDKSQLTRCGTAGYIAPSWYVAGHPDMYSAAALLFFLLTGNNPDKIGRSAFRQPPQGNAQYSLQEHEYRKRLFSVVRRAVDEKPSERFVDFKAFENALRVPLSKPVPKPIPKRRNLFTPKIILPAALAGIALGFGITKSAALFQNKTAAVALPASRYAPALDAARKNADTYRANVAVRRNALAQAEEKWNRREKFASEKITGNPSETKQNLLTASSKTFALRLALMNEIEAAGGTRTYSELNTEARKHHETIFAQARILAENAGEADFFEKNIAGEFRQIAGIFESPLREPAPFNVPKNLLAEALQKTSE